MKLQRAKIWVLALLSMAGGGHSAAQLPYTSIDPNDNSSIDKVVFLFNVSENKWVQNVNPGNRPNNNAEIWKLGLGTAGFAFTIVESKGTGHMKLNSMVDDHSCCLSAREDNNLLSFNYPNRDYDQWDFNKNGDNYRLYRVDYQVGDIGGRGYLNYNSGQLRSNNSTGKADWRFVTPTQRLNYLKENVIGATAYNNAPEYAKDVSWLLTNFDFKTGFGSEREKWQGLADIEWSNSPVYKRSFKTSGDRDVHQVIEQYETTYAANDEQYDTYGYERIPNGKYVVSVLGAYNGGSAAQLYAYDDVRTGVGEIRDEHSANLPSTTETTADDWNS